MRFQTQFHFSFEIAAFVSPKKRFQGKMRRRGGRHSECPKDGGGTKFTVARKLWRGKAVKMKKKPRSQPESLGYSVINVGWAVLPSRIARSGATEQRLLHGSVNRDTSFQYPGGRPCEKGQAFRLPLWALVGQGICRNPFARAPSAESNKKSLSDGQAAGARLIFFSLKGYCRAFRLLIFDV